MLRHVDDLNMIINRISKPVHLIGHSYGAFMCLLLAIQSPQLIKSLVLSEPPVITLFVSNKPKPGELINLLFTRPKTAVSIINFGVNGIGPATKMIQKNNLDRAIEIFGSVTLGHEACSKLSPERIEQVKANVIKAEFLGSKYPAIDESKIGKINIPVLLLEGEKSPKLFHLLLDRLEQLLRHKERIKIPNASHICHEDNAEIFNKTVLSFINRHSN